MPGLHAPEPKSGFVSVDVEGRLKASRGYVGLIGRV